MDEDRSYTPTGVRRAGDDYQDTVGLQLLVEWLEHPARYSWVRLEADDAGYLDDIVAQRSDGLRVFRQVKFSAHPDQSGDPWTWDQLLETRPGKPRQDETLKTLPSLLGKWASTCKSFIDDGLSFDARVISNRRAGSELQLALRNGFIDFDSIAEFDVRNKIVEQVGNEDLTRAVLAKLQFELDRPGIEVLEESTFRRFMNLGGTETGWLQLSQAVRRWVRYRDEPPPQGEIALTDVRRVAQWFRLQALPQQFAIPEDYVLPSADFHKQVIVRLRRDPGKCHVITGTPGVGKSTYSSYLYCELKKQQMPVIRHHYFLSLTERISYRVDHQRAAESLMHDLLHEYPQALGSLASSNPNPLAHDLRNWIEVCGQHFTERGSILIVIIDGLDHVWRERRSVEELQKLLDLLLPCPIGVSLLLAMQPVGNDQLPPVLTRNAPRDQWLELPMLDVVAVENWLRFHQRDLAFAEDGIAPDHILERVTNSLYSKSGGHPLHLRYSVRMLQERGQVINAENIDSLPSCPHQEITAYYDELWQALSDEGRLILHLFASCDFVWPPRGSLLKLSLHSVLAGFPFGELLQNFFGF